jgi:hypothetical protein
MKLNAKLKSASLFALLVTVVSLSFAQDLENPGNYMSYINDKERLVTKTYLNYMSAVSHGKSARKVEKLREKVLNTIFETRMDISGTPPFRGDRSLRDASVARLKTCYSVFNEDYGKIVNLEEIAEQSYDAMEAYMLAQQKAGEKLDEAGDVRENIAKQFAAKHNVNIIDTKDELVLKAEKSAQVIDYYNKVYLIFFKSNKQEAYLTEAANAGDVNAVEQNRNALLKYATEGLQALEGVKAFDSDLTLVTACKKALLFYKNECEHKSQVVSDYLMANENFKKLKKAFDQKPAAKRTQADIDQFNKSVDEINKVGKEFNKANNELNNERTALLNMWNKTVQTFMDMHMPYSR